MNTNDGGTPADPKDGTGDGGTPKAAEGTGGRSPSVDDYKAMEQKHRENLEKERAASQAKDQRIADLEQRVFGSASAPPADPQLAMIQDLQQRAPFDPNAQASLESIRASTVAQLENRLTNDILELGVPREQIGRIRKLVRESGYNMTTADAAQMARGTTVDAVEAKLKQTTDELEATKKELAAQKTRVPNMATVPALVVDPAAHSVPASQYNAILARGGSEARALYDRTKIPKGQPGHVEIQFGE